MNQEDKLKHKYGTEGGWTVPEGYFEKVYAEIESKLPPYKEAEREVKLTRWQRVKPYVYLAAMFAGIWMMMQVFHRVSGSTQLNLDNPPEQIAMAMVEPEITDLYTLTQSMSDVELEEELCNQYNSIEEFERDFNSLKE